jgi:hypothetical protein
MTASETGSRSSGTRDDLQFDASIVLADEHQSISKLDRINRIDDNLNVRYPDPVLPTRSNDPYSFHVEYVIHARRSATSEPISSGLEPVGVARSAIRRRRRVAPDHLPGPPAGQSHQVMLLTAGGQPVVREGVPELMGGTAGIPASPQRRSSICRTPESVIRPFLPSQSGGVCAAS